MVSMLRVKDAMPISRRDFPSCITIPSSQRKENGASASACPAVGAQHDGLAAPDFRQTHFVHRDRGLADGPRGSFRKTTLCSTLTPVSRPAVPSVNSNTTGPVLLKCMQMAPAQTHRAGPHAGVLRPGGERGGSRLGLAGGQAKFVRIEFHPVIAAGQDHREQAGMNGDFRRSAQIGGAAGSRAIAAPIGFGRRRRQGLAVLPGWAGNGSVRNIHEQPLCEAFQTAKRSPRSEP